MSPNIVPEEDSMHCFPRVSGDEPAIIFCGPSRCEFSPRERG